MVQVRKLAEADIKDYALVQINAYPGWIFPDEEGIKKLEQQVAETLSSEPYSNFYGLYEDNVLLGAMRTNDYIMTVHNEAVQVGGLASVAVDLLHKKEKVAKQMVEFFLNLYRQKGYGMVCLCPFRPDFYKKMGFGYGTKSNEYRVKPESLPKEGAKRNVTFASQEEKNALLECYNRYASKIHGMIHKNILMMDVFLKDVQNRVIVYKEKGELSGYMIFRFRMLSESNPMLYDLQVLELVYENSSALNGLLAFLQSQLDQVRRIIFNTQDEYFHFLFSDPRDGSENVFRTSAHESNLQGTGIMYRVIDMDAMFKALKGHNFGNQNFKLKINLKDDFLEPNNGSTIVHFVNGNANIAQSLYDIEIDLGISEFSSLIMGTIDFKHLYNFGLAKISDVSYMDRVNMAFYTENKPICTVAF